MQYQVFFNVTFDSLYIIKKINNLVWGVPMIILLLGIHIFFTFRLKFVQRHIIKALKYTFTKSDNQNVSALSTLSTTLAATLGTGNIIGISTAIYLGGPGAIFWCWITGILGMATSYAECFLSIKYRIKKNNTYLGGPMYVLKYALNKKILAMIFAICTILASFGVGCTTQSNSIITAFNSLTKNLLYTNNLNNDTILHPHYIIKLTPHLIGIILSLLVGFVILGGFNSISNICMKLVPSMALFYTLGCFYLLCTNASHIPIAISTIIKSAFSSKCIIAGFTGTSITAAIRYGVSRGLFTNEAGLGSTPITASMSDSHPIATQSIISMSATFLDTVVMCAITGITIVTTFIAHNFSITDVLSTDLVTMSFGTIPYIGEIFLSLSLIAFAYATLIGWFTFGEQAFHYIFPTLTTNLYKIAYLVMIYLGAILSLDMVWELCDLFNALMAFPNIISLILLYKEIKPFYL